MKNIFSLLLILFLFSCENQNRTSSLMDGMDQPEQVDIGKYLIGKWNLHAPAVTTVKGIEALRFDKYEIEFTTEKAYFNTEFEASFIGKQTTATAGSYSVDGDKVSFEGEGVGYFTFRPDCTLYMKQMSSGGEMELILYKR